MWRNILGQAVYQIGWLLALLFEGKNMFDCTNMKNISNPAEVPRCYYDASTEFYYFNTVPSNKTVIYTIIFQTFVFMQIVN